jgi:hypothetical protein
MRAQPSTSTNPLVRARLDAGLTQTELAHQLRISRNVVKWAEAGTYNQIPSAYHDVFPELVEQLDSYQEFRKAKRQDEFPGFAGCVVHSVPEFLDLTELLPNTFAMKACVPHSEVFRALTTGRASTSIRGFFLTIGVEYEGD